MKRESTDTYLHAFSPPAAGSVEVTDTEVARLNRRSERPASNIRGASESNGHATYPF